MELKKDSHSVEVCILGSKGVGKTSLISKLLFDDQDHHFVSQTQQFHRLLIKTPKNNYKLRIMELSCLHPKENQLLLVDFQIFILIFDLMKLEETLNPILDFLKYIPKENKSKMKNLLIANKIDLFEEVG